MSDKPNEHIQRGQREEEIVVLRMENQFLRKQLEHERSEREAISKAAESFMLSREKALQQLSHERSEREAAQRTIARLGGGIDEEPLIIICANAKCLASVQASRTNQRFCSSRCKSAAGVRRHRAKNGGGES